MFYKNKDKIANLEKEIKSLFKKTESARLAAHYHKKQMDKALDKNKPKDFEKHDDRYRFYSNLYDKLKLRIEGLKREISDIEYEQEKAEQEKKAIEFRSEAIRLFEGISQSLKEDDYNQALNLSEELSTFYLKEVDSADKKGLELMKYVRPQSVKIRLSNILETQAEALRISATKGPQVAAEKRSKIALWSKHLKGQLDTAIEMLQGKS